MYNGNLKKLCPFYKALVPLNTDRTFLGSCYNDWWAWRVWPGISQIATLLLCPIFYLYFAYLLQSLNTLRLALFSSSPFIKLYIHLFLIGFNLTAPCVIGSREYISKFYQATRTVKIMHFSFHYDFLLIILWLKRHYLHQQSLLYREMNVLLQTMSSSLAIVGVNCKVYYLLALN